MSPVDFRRLMGRLKTNEVKLGVALGTTATQVHRWRYGEDEIPSHVALKLQQLEAA